MAEITGRDLTQPPTRDPGGPAPWTDKPVNRWSARRTANFMLGVLGAFWAIVALVVHLLA